MKKFEFLYVILLVVITASILISTKFIGNPYEFSKPVYYFRFFLIILNLLLLLVILRNIIRAGLSERIKRYLSVGVTILIIIFIFEGVFMFVSRSFSSPYPLASQNWVRKYWLPTINSLGYRDIEIDAATLKGKSKIVVLGSSYVAGDGIEDTSDRFTDQLQEKFPDNYRVFNIGYCGSNIIDQFKRLQEFSVKPDILILSHTTKSIKGNKDSGSKKEKSRIPGNPGFFVQNSYLLNYVFWKFIAPGKLFEKYIEDIDNNHIFSYLDDEKLNAHFSNLNRFIAYSNENSIPLIVVLFPSMNIGIGFSEVIVNRQVADFFRSKNIPVINVYDFVKDIPAKDRIINSNNPHPSSLVHSIVADELYNTIVQKTN